MRRLLSVIVSFISAMTFAQQQPAELTPQDSRTMLQIGKSYLGTQYVANTLDRDGEEELVIRTDAVDCLTFVEYTLAQALGSSFTENLQRYATEMELSTDILPVCITPPIGSRMVSVKDSLRM